MRKLPSVTLAAALAATSLTMAVSFSAPALADAPDPTPHLIYEAAAAGHFDEAQRMMDQVLKDHPRSGKAHYIQAELYAKEGKTALARSELAQAEEYDPGLTKEDAHSVQELKSQLGLIRGNQAPRYIGTTNAPAPGIHWGLIFIVVLAIVALWLLFRRRNTYQTYATGPVISGGPAGYGGPGGYGGPAGYGGVPYGGGPMGGGGIGSGIAGGLASGLAVGAGVVAGEELAHHFLDGDRREGVAPPVADNGNWEQSSNSDMGGTDFGVNDSSSWDDSSGGGDGGGGGGGGGDDWT